MHNSTNFFLTTHYLPQSICLTNEHFLSRMPRQKCIFQNDVIFIEFFSLDFLYCIIPYRTGSDIQVYRIVSPLDEIVQYRYRYRGLSIHSVSQELTYGHAQANMGCDPLCDSSELNHENLNHMNCDLVL